MAKSGGGGGKSGNAGGNHVIGGKGSSDGGKKGGTSSGYGGNNNKSSGGSQTGWGGNAGGLLGELKEFNNSTFNLGVENEPVSPFWTQQDIEEHEEAKEQYLQGLAALDEAYNREKSKDAYEETEIETGRKESATATNWDAAGRGLFHSSIRNADLSDIDATAEIKKKFLSDSLQALQVYNEGQKQAADNRWNRYEEAYNRKATENAEGINSQMPKYAVEPHWESGPAPVQPPKSQQPAKFTPGKISKGAASRVPNSSNGGIEAPSSNTGKNGHAIGSGEIAQRPKMMKPAAASGYATSKIAGKLYG